MFSTAVSPGRKRRGEGHTRREEILQAAKELFLEEGYDHTTIRRIADRVGISAPALYLYFEDKEALMLALCDQTFEHLVQAISEIERTVEDPLERIRRFGEASCPLDETLAKVVVDLSGRPYLSYNVKIRPGRVGDFDTDLPHEFYAAFTNQLGMNLHIDVIRGENPHHIIEACFKAFARAMDMATQLDGRIQGVLSTKGSL